MSDASCEHPVFHILETGIPQWVHVSLSRQYAHILDEPVPAELLALLMPEGQLATDAPTLADTSPHEMAASIHACAVA
ncbi:hypothetical protein IFJ82_06355 [Novacetimonas hansenii]|uniref:hypothetical protein n=1 Tax=Novacetimonas hansenii TaxID=436 RepID=UPI0017809731|nr:hypothetical protein [Novacetimonas hansenii]QOF96194.1 hypothetical protein IFJ82_06355 [Novacetimonas hansenii]